MAAGWDEAAAGWSVRRMATKSRTTGRSLSEPLPALHAREIALRATCTAPRSARIVCVLVIHGAFSTGGPMAVYVTGRVIAVTGLLG